MVVVARAEEATEATEAATAAATAEAGRAAAAAGWAGETVSRCTTGSSRCEGQGILLHQTGK